MAAWGQTIGAILGTIVGGPTGGAIGSQVGGLLDSSGQENQAEESRKEAIKNQILSDSIVAKYSGFTGRNYQGGQGLANVTQNYDRLLQNNAANRDSATAGLFDSLFDVNKDAAGVESSIFSDLLGRFTNNDAGGLSQTPGNANSGINPSYPTPQAKADPMDPTSYIFG